MNLATLISAMAKKKFSPTAQEPHIKRDPVPLRASQGAAVQVEQVPIIIANSKGSLFGDVQEHSTVTAVGQFTLFNGSVRYYHIYLSGIEGGFLSIAMQGTKIIETRLYRVYADVTPGDIEEWKFWLPLPFQDREAINAPEDEGYIGNPIVKNLDSDGGLPYTRSWAPGNSRVLPNYTVETIRSVSGDLTYLHHKLMHYSRRLNTDEPVAEHLLVSAIAEHSNRWQMNDSEWTPSGVMLWLGIDVELSEIKVYPASDTPAFP